MGTRGPMVLGLALVALALTGSLWFLSRLAPGQPPAATPDRLSAYVPRGEVAVVVRASAAAGAGSAARRGDRVDVYAFFPAPSPEREAVSRLVMENTLVYGSAPSGDTYALALAMPPGQALLMHQATQLGAKPFVVLRSSQGSRTGASPTRLSDSDLRNLARQLARQQVDGTR